MCRAHQPACWRSKCGIRSKAPRVLAKLGGIFLKKLNTIRKCIRHGQWTPPVAMLEAADNQALKVVQASKLALQNALGEQAHWVRMRDVLANQGDVKKADYYTQAILRSEAKVTAMHEELNSLLAQEEVTKMPWVGKMPNAYFDSQNRVDSTT